MSSPQISISFITFSRCSISINSMSMQDHGLYTEHKLMEMLMGYTRGIKYQERSKIRSSLSLRGSSLGLLGSLQDSFLMKFSVILLMLFDIYDMLGMSQRDWTFYLFFFGTVTVVRLVISVKT